MSKLFFSALPLLKKFQIDVSRFNLFGLPVCITLQQVSSNLKELIWNLHYTDEDQKSETIAYSCQVIEKLLLGFEKKNLQHVLQLAVYASMYNSIQFSSVEY